MSGWLADWRNSWLFDWLIFWSVDWLILWFPRCLTDCKVLWMNDWLINWMIDWFSDWLTYLLADWVSDWLIDDWTSMDQARIGQQTNLQMDQNWLIEWLSDWLIDWLIYRPHEKSVLITLLKFTLVAMILLPISYFFLFKKIFFEGNHIIFGTKSTEVFLNFPFHSQDFNSNFPKFHIFPYIFLAVFVLGICFSTN